jgi:hypothetical protein
MIDVLVPVLIKLLKCVDIADSLGFNRLLNGLAYSFDVLVHFFFFLLGEEF